VQHGTQQSQISSTTLPLARKVTATQLPHMLHLLLLLLLLLLLQGSCEGTS
jgi:hypothetical protein